MAAFMKGMDLDLDVIISGAPRAVNGYSIHSSHSASRTTTRQYALL